MIARSLVAIMLLSSSLVSASVSFDISVYAPPSANPGKEFTYIVTFANTGTSYANDVSVTLNLPAAGLYTYSSSVPAGVYSAGSHTVTWTSAQVPYLANLGAGIKQFIVKVYPGTMGSLYHPLWNPGAYYMPGTINTLTASASIHSQQTPIPVQSAPVLTTVMQYCGVGLHDMEGEIKSATGSVVYYLMSITNNGNISDNFTLTASEAPGSQVYLIPEIMNLSKSLITETGWVAPGNVYYFYLKLTAPNGTPANRINLTQVTGTSQVCNISSSSLVTTFSHNPLGPLLTSMKLDYPDPVQSGDTLEYTIYIYNSGKEAGTNLTITETYDPRTTFLSAVPAPTTGNNVWVFPSLGVESSTTVTIKMLVQNNLVNGTVLSNTCLATCLDSHGNPISDSETELTTVSSAPNLKITKTALPFPDPAKPSGIVTYTISYSNLGNYTASNVTIMDDYDEDLATVTNAGGGIDNGHFITWNIGTLAPNASGTKTFVVVIKDLSHFTSGSTALINNASIFLTEFDADYADNFCQTTTMINLLPNLHTTKTVDTDPGHAGENLTYQVFVSNNGDLIANNVMLRDTLPAGVTFVSASGGGTYASGVVTWNLGSIAPLASQSRSVVVNPDCSNIGSITNRANVSSSVVDADESDNRYVLNSSVIDNTSPTISCVANQTRSTDPGVCTYTSAGGEFNPTSYGDNCSGATIRNNINGTNTLTGAVFTKGTTTVTWTVTDASGHTATCSFDVTVNDNQNPTLSCVGNQTRNTNNGVCTYTAVGTEFDPTAFSDNCPGAVISNNHNSSNTLAGAIFTKGTTTVTWTVTDASGHTATCNFDVTVNDNQNPTISCVGNQTRNTNNGVCTYTAVGTEFDPTAFSDNCPGAVISNNHNSSNTLAGAVFTKGTTTVTWTITDASGHTATCNFDVTVNDNQNPTISC
ncbi:MAG TPA: HYR domain-containing protein, partial [Bacteroidales bacterium]|nr:HYR domain-containing protein [Bacteroidales bacterium]